MALNKKLKLCGHFLVTFANEKTIYKSIDASIPIIQKIFNFDSKFVEKARRANLSIDFDRFNFDALEGETLDLLISEVDLIEYIQTLLIQLRLNLIDFDIYKRMVFFRDATAGVHTEMAKCLEIQYEDTITNKINKVTRYVSLEKKRIWGTTIRDKKIFETSIDDIEPFFKERLRSINSSKTKNQVPKYFQENLTKFISKTEKLFKLRAQVYERFNKHPYVKEKFTNLRDFPTLNLELEFRKCKNDLIDLLNLIVGGGKLYDSRTCDRFISGIEYVMPKPILQPDDVLENVVTVVTEDHFYSNKYASGVLANNDGHIVSKLATFDLHVPYWNTICYCLAEILQYYDYKAHFGQCDSCDNFYFSETKRKNRKYCSNYCKSTYHNTKRIESGEAARYKREKRAQGAKESYYG